MKKFLIWLFFIATVYVVQASFLPLVAYHGVSPDLLLLATVSFSILQGEKKGLLFGFMAGLIQDLATGTFFGVDIFSKMLIGYGCGIFSQRLFKEQIMLPVMASLAAVAVNYFILEILMFLLGYRFNILSHLQLLFLPMVCDGVILSYPMYLVVQWFCRLQHTEK